MRLKECRVTLKESLSYPSANIQIHRGQKFKALMEGSEAIITVHGKKVRLHRAQYLEEMPYQDIIKAEDRLDNIFKELGLDAVFTTHFKDRLQGRESDVTVVELEELFRKVLRRYKADLQGKEFEAVVRDFGSKLNVPIVVKKDRVNKGEKDVIMKTVMRKGDFKSQGKILKV